jgi:hypothetical protein
MHNLLSAIMYIMSGKLCDDSIQVIPHISELQVM